MLADSNLAYRGTLKDMCDFFGVSSGDSRNNKNIKAAIQKLEEDRLLKQIIDGRTYTLTLSKKGEQRKRVIRIQKEWVEIARKYKADDPNHSVSWMNLLKVWLYLIDNKRPVITTAMIAEDLNISESVVKNAKRALVRDIQAVISERCTHYTDGEYRCEGSAIIARAWLD